MNKSVTPEEPIFNGYGYLALTDVLNGARNALDVNSIELHIREYNNVVLAFKADAYITAKLGYSKTSLLHEKAMFDYLESQGVITIVVNRSHWPAENWTTS